MADQSKIQSIVQNLQGTHTQGQSNVPSSAQTGNPNSVYNWTTYLPSVGTTNGRPSVNFDLLTSQAPASSPGYTPPFTADPYAAMVMSSMPRASENPIIANLLAGYRGGQGQPPGSGGGGGGGTPTTPPTGPGPGGPGTGTGGGGGNAGQPIGPISGPIDQNTHNWANNYANAQPNTNLNDSGLGRNAALPWATTTWGSTPISNQPGGSQVMDALRNLGSSLTGQVKDSFNKFLDNLTGQNGWQGMVGTLLDTMVPGASMLINQFFPQNDPGGPMDPALVAQTNAKLASQLQNLMGTITQDSGAAAQARLEQLLNGSAGQLPAGWSTDTWNASDWGKKQEFMNFVNLFSRSGGQGKNPITGMPSGSLIENMQNANLEKVMDFVKRMQERRGQIER